MTELSAMIVGFISGFVLSVLCCVAVLQREGYFEKESKND